tara:strand:+ start:1628 stop:2251 length:624 start_codon:yes stop_codon:yes gene_type:complete
LIDKTSKAWERRKKDRPTEILDSTISILSKDGYTKLSMKRVAKEAGVSEATIFKYFEDKEDLIDKCYYRVGLEVVSQFEKDTQANNNLYDSLQHIARTNFLRLKSNQNIWDIFTHDINQRIRKNSQVYKCKKRYETLLTKLIAMAQKNKELIASVNPRTILNMFFGPIEYIAIKYRMYGEDFDIDENVNDIVNTIFRAYSTKEDFKK